MATTVDTLLVRIDADLSDLRTQLGKLDSQLNTTQRKVNGTLSKIADGFRTVLGAAVVFQTARAALAVVNFVSHVEEAQAKADVVFGQFAGSVRDQLGQFADEVGRSRFELEEMAASVQDTFVPLGFARGEAAKLSVELAKLATDVASFNNASDTETMIAFQSALVGNHETVRRFGIVITEATLQQELYRMGIKKTTQEASNSEKVQARLNLIMNGTTDAHGDAARTSDSFANRSKALGAALDELAVAVLGPLMDDFADFVQLLTNAVKGINSFMQAVGLAATVEAPASLADISEEINQYTQELKVAQAEVIRIQDILKQAEKAPLGSDTVKAMYDAQILGLNITIDSLKANIAQLEKARAELQAQTSESVVEAPKQEQSPKLVKDYQSATDKLTDSIALLRLQQMGANESHLEFQELMLKMPGLTDEQVAALLKLHQAETQLKAQIDSVTEAQERASEAAEKETAELAKVDEMIVKLAHEKGLLEAANAGATESELALIEALQGIGNITPEQVEKLKTLTIEIENLKNVSNTMMDETARIFESAGARMADSLADAFINMEFSLKSFRSIAQDIVRQIISTFLRLAVVNAAINSMFNLSGAKALPTIPIGGAAGGGTVAPKVPVLVGERGPELFVPSSAGRVMNNMNTQNAMGGGQPVVVNQSINVQTGVAQTVRAEVMNLMPVIRDQAVNAVVESRRRGGTVASSFGA